MTSKITVHMEMLADHTLVDEARGRSALKAGSTYAVDLDIAERLIDAKVAAPASVNIAGDAPADGSSAISILDELNARHAAAHADPAAATVVSHPTGDVISDPSAPPMTTKEG